MMSLAATVIFLVLMCLGLPIAASLGLAAGAVIFWYDLPLAVVAQRTVNSLDSTPLLAVPMFIFAACIFNTAGITQHLDHIVSVGANAIYLTPIFAADTNHRYDTKDYFRIDTALGRSLLDKGVRMISYSADALVFRRACQDIARLKSPAR